MEALINFSFERMIKTDEKLTRTRSYLEFFSGNLLYTEIPDFLRADKSHVTIFNQSEGLNYSVA